MNRVLDNDEADIIVMETLQNHSWLGGISILRPVFKYRRKPGIENTKKQNVPEIKLIVYQPTVSRFDDITFIDLSVQWQNFVGWEEISSSIDDFNLKGPS